jgi:hypothetical protein
MPVSDLEGEVVAVATALGLVSNGHLDTAFFSDPLGHLRTIVSDTGQRTALLTALDALLPPPSAGGTQQADGATTTRHPIVHNDHGTLALSITRSGPADDPVVLVGLWGSATHAASGCQAEVDLPLVQGSDTGAAVVAGTLDHPMAVAARVPVGWTRADHPIGLAAATLSALVIAPPHLASSRIVLDLAGLDVGAGPADLVLDGADLAADLSHILTTVLLAGLEQAAGSAGSDLVTQLVAHLPSVLGLDGQLPALPIGALISDEGAFRTWIGSLLTATVDSRPALLHWLDQIGQLLGAPALAGTLTALPGPASPLLIPVVDGGTDGFGVSITAYVQTPAASTTPQLHLGLQAGIAGPVAALRASAGLLVVPLGGNAATTVLPSAELVVESAGRLWPRGTATDDVLRIGIVRGGLRYDGTHVVPVLELDNAFVNIPEVTAQAMTFDRLDLTSARTLAAAANQTVKDFLNGHLGGDPTGTALLTLAGLGSNASDDQFAAFANDPLRAIGAFHRAALTAGTYQPVATQILALFGVTAPVTGNGTAADPWFAPLTAVAIPGTSALQLGVAVWDVPSGADHELHVGLRLGTPPAAGRPSWSVSLDADLVTFALPAGAAMHAGFLGGIDLAATLNLPHPAGAAVVADALQTRLHWKPGAPLATDLAVTGVEITIDGTTVGLGDIALPQGIDKATLGSAWNAIRLLLARAAASWAGSGGAALASLLGLGDPLGALPPGWPALTLPAGGIDALLDDPLAALRDYLAAVVGAAVAESGQIPFRSALDLLTGLLSGTLPGLSRPDLPPLPAGVAVAGGGTYEQPWAIPLTDPSTPLVAEPIELLAWLEPGPPASWAAAAAAALGTDEPDVAGVLGDVSTWVPQVRQALTGLDPDRMTPWLSALGDAVDGTDGLVPPFGADDLPTGFSAGPTVTAAHHLVPQAADAVAAVAAHLTVHAAGAPVVLLAPSFAPADVWSGLLAAAGAPTPVTIDLRVPGVDPARVDLGPVGAGTHYLVDLADDGAPSLADLGARLDRVVQRVLAVTGATRVALVGHSSAGLVATAYAAAHTTACGAVATLAAPFTALDPALALAGETAGGVRLANVLAPGALAGTPALAAALGHLATALDGCVAGAPSPYPIAAFTRALPAGLDLSAVPALAIGAQLEVPVSTALASALGSALPTAGAAPTHLAWGLRTEIQLGSSSGTAPRADAHARLDLGRVRLVAAAADPAHPAHRLAVDVLVTDPSGWLVGSAGTGSPLDVRVRAAQLSIVHTPGQGTTFDASLYDAGVRGSGGPIVGLGDVAAAELLRAVVDRLAAAAADAASSAHGLVTVLQALGLASFDEASHTAAIYADALASVQADAGAWLAARLPGVLGSAATTLGLTADPPASGVVRTWRRTLGALPIELVVSDGPWSVGIATTGRGLALGGGVAITAAATLPFSPPNSTPTVGATIAAELTVAGISVGCGSGALTVAAAPVLDPITVLPPPPGTALRDALAAALARTGLSAAVSALLQDAVGGAVPIGSLTGLFADAGGWLREAGRFGAPAGGFDVARIAPLVDTLAQVFGLPAHDGSLHLADGLDVTVTAAGTGGLAFGLQANHLGVAPAGITLDAGLSVRLGADRSVTPAGTVAVTVPLDGGWPTLQVQAGAAAGGMSLAVTPGGASAIELLPQFAGLWDLLSGAAQALLPGVLNTLVDKISSAGSSDILDTVLAVADGLGLRTGTPPQFDSAALAALVASVQQGTLVPTAQSLAGVVTALLPAGAPLTVTGTGTTLSVEVTSLPVPGTATLTAHLPGSGTPADLGIELDGVKLGPVVAGLTLADTGGTFTIAGDLGIDLADAVGFAFTPALHVAGGPGPLSIALRPLGPSSPLTLALAPTPQIQPGRAQLADLITGWAVPVIARAALEAAQNLIGTPLWASGPTAQTLLSTAGLIQGIGGIPRLVEPLPDPMTLLRGLLAAAATAPIPISAELSLRVYDEGGTWVGLAAAGSIDIPAGDFLLTILLGSPDVTTWTDPPPGLAVLLLDDSSALAVRPAVRLGGVGVRLGKTSGSLVDTDEIRIKAIRAMAQAAIDLSGAHPGVTALHGGVEIEQIGLPLGGSSDPSNPIAASLLKPSGGGAGDDQPADPPSDLYVVSDDSGQLVVQINGKAAEQPFYVDINKAFGPLHIDRIGLAHKMLAAGDGIGALLDAGVDISGLSIEVQGLELDIPLKHPAELDQWQVDLSGLAVSFETGPVSIAGGLLKTSAGGTVEYDGELSVQVGSFGLSAIGAYSKPTDGTDSYTSLFAVVVIDAPIGGPPYLFVTGLAGGAGYNRQLIVPADPATIPSFPLVKVFDGGASTDPMGTLRSMSAAMPARRASYWVAAGVKFDTFELLHTKAIAYVALDRGFEIGLIGLMTMALPAPDTAVVSVELALLARYSSTDELLAIRAQLTNNSWLISRDCQLTGGFAFYAWFGADPQVLLTIGGYGPNWQIAPGDTHQYPVVPAVGFHWAVGGGIVVKGETYFALTPHQLAFGGRLEASYDVDPIRVWLMVWLDVELEWDPLHYHLDAGISIGASFHFTIDLLFGSITISVTISLGGSIVIEGPPLQGSVTVELEIASVTVGFGQHTPQNFLPWNAFVAKYAGLPAPTPDNPTASDPGSQTSLGTITFGQLAETSPAGGPSGGSAQPNGSLAAPWQVLPEFGLSFGSKTPLFAAAFAGTSVTGVDTTGFDLPAMGPSGPGFRSSLSIRIEPWSGISAGAALAPQHEIAATTGGFALSTWAKNIPPDSNNNPVVSSPTMAQAMSGVLLTFPATVQPASGRPDIPISTLVEEGKPVQRLPFAAAAAGVLTPTLVTAAATAPASTAPATRAPARLHAILTVSPSPAGGHTVVRGHGHGHAGHARLHKTDAALDAGAVSVAAGESHAWLVGPGHRVQVAPGSGLRVTALSPVGRVVLDHLGSDHPDAGDGGSGRDIALPAESARVVLTRAGAAGAASGWTSGSVLAQVGPATALGARCTVLLPRPVTAPSPAPPERRVPARALLAGLPGVQTILPPGTRRVVVVLERADARAHDDLVIRGDGLRRPADTRTGTRRVLSYAVNGEPGPTVSVASYRAWRVVAVYGFAAAADEWAQRLGADPYLAVPLDPPGAGNPAEYRITAEEAGS